MKYLRHGRKLLNILYLISFNSPKTRTKCYNSLFKNKCKYWGSEGLRNLLEVAQPIGLNWNFW